MMNQPTEYDLAETLQKIGLTESQAKAYLYLISNGESTPPELADGIGESRTNSYMITEKLVKLGLARKSQSAKSAYTAENPLKLKQFLIRRQRQIRESSSQLDGVLPSLTSKYHLVSDQPGVITAEGVEALRVVYDAIIRTNQEVLIFPSPYDRDDKAMSEMIDKQILRQKQAGIPVKSLVHASEHQAVGGYTDNLLEIRTIPEHIRFDAQIMVFGNNTVFTTYNTGLVSTIMTSPQVAATMRGAFWAIWENSGTV